MGDLLIRNVRDVSRSAPDLCDVRIRSGRIDDVGPLLAVEAGVPIEDGMGALLLPGLVEGHTHLDKTMWGMDWYVNEVGPELRDRIDNERALRARSGHDAQTQSHRLALAFLALGATRIRTHVDIDTDAGLKHLRGVLATQEKLRGVVEIQIVAFPQSGVLQRPGTVDLLHAALREGADVLGGLDPQGIDGDAPASIDSLFAVAERHGCPLDIHLHEAGAMGARSLDLILDRTEALGMAGRVAISHGFCLGDVDESTRMRLLARMAALRVAVFTTGTPSRPVPSLLACHAAGVTMAGGNDGIRDAWTPYGSPDMLERAMLIGLRNNLRRDDEVALAFDTVAAGAAGACGFGEYGLAPGTRADLVLVHAQNLAHAVVEHPPRALVVSHGRIVARNGVLV